MQVIFRELTRFTFGHNYKRRAFSQLWSACYYWWQQGWQQHGLLTRHLDCCRLPTIVLSSVLIDQWSIFGIILMASSCHVCPCVKLVIWMSSNEGLTRRPHRLVSGYKIYKLQVHSLCQCVRCIQQDRSLEIWEQFYVFIQWPNVVNCQLQQANYVLLKM